MSRQFEIKQKMWSLGGKFTIKDESGKPAYEVKGSFLQIPKTFTLSDMSGNLISQIEKKMLTFLPQFTVSLSNGQSFVLKKQFTWFKPRYSLSGLNMTVQGDWWDMNFTLSQKGRKIAEINQAWLAMTSTYQVTVLDDAYADLVISLVVAIDYVKEQEAAAASSSAT
ncbi:LURP-one-related/scramblase family protein [Streptococcus moroccensis]|uniref:Uncharacterized protein YxjI n=1 Tax=Streptococcus moroccensis TaxID=1451356 RepID=A0ABT9YQI7_9STRE|nr:LURP-one-related family protein [Streptococcus moroccensis]MDQ0222152.1 uncharacterized protein YxjI [Streptococcus moroccensis]